MCGRMGRAQEHERVERHFGVGWPDGLGCETYNIAPQSIQPVIIQSGEKRQVRLMKWGLVPSWAKSLDIGFSTFNARAEEIAFKPAFRDSIQTRRCLVPADFFYEWQKIGRAKQPFAIAMRDGSVFAFAGIWDQWHQAGIALESFSIITTEANEVITPIHNRMPVIIAPADYNRWLAATSAPLDLLKPYPAEQMHAWPVSARVGNTQNDDKRLIEAQPSESLFG